MASTRHRRSNLVDEQAVDAFLRTTFPRLVAALTLMSGSRAAAEDAVCEALARAWERSERGEHIESLAAWTTTVATNVARSRLRRLRVELRARAASPVPAGEVDLDEFHDLRTALQRLPRREREATVLRYYLDLDVAEVADALGVSAGAVKTTLHRARHKLSAALGEVATEETTRHGT